MKVVLLKDDKKHGKKGDVINVSDGFATNYLIPNGIAAPATSTSLNESKQLKESEKHHKQVLLDEAKLHGKQLKDTVINFKVKVGENGKVFGSITNKEIATELSKLGLNVDRKKIDLPQPIKNTGNFNVKIKLHPEVVSTIKVVVDAE